VPDTSQLCSWPASLVAVTGIHAVTTQGTLRSDAHICAYAAHVDWTPEEIRRRRDAHGLSQDELGRRIAAHLGLDKPVSRRAIVNWENGTAVPHGRNLRALDHVLGAQTSSDDPPLSQASYMDLLAELARRYARATDSSAQPRPSTGSRYKIYTEDAPTPEHPGQDQLDATERGKAP